MKLLKLTKTERRHMQRYQRQQALAKLAGKNPHYRAHHQPGTVVRMSDRAYDVFKDGSFRRIAVIW